MKRRDFIKTTGMLSLAGIATKNLMAKEMKIDNSLSRFGIITGNTCGKWLEDNPKEALKKLSGWGYRDLEFGGTYGMEPKELKAFLNDLNLIPLIGSTSMAAMTDTTQLMKDIILCQELDKKYIACYWPWTDDGQNKKLDDWKKVADQLNRGGELCKAEGLQLLYHNHDIEFKVTEGQIPFDTLMPAMNPEFVKIELDLYWITKGDQSAIEYIRKYPGRYPVFHVKDMDKTPNRSFEYVGDGCIDFPSIFKLNQIAGVQHFIVEHDKPADYELCARKAATYLSGLNF